MVRMLDKGIGSAWAGYGSNKNYDDMTADLPHVHMRFIPGDRFSINILAIVVNIFGPWIMFATLLIMFSFKFHYQHGDSLFGIVFGIVVFLCCLASLAYRRSKKEHATWLWFALIALSVNLVVASSCGQYNYKTYMQSYYEFSNLNTYPDVNPRTDPGQQLMDAGRVSFHVGTNLDHTKAMTFMNSDLFCVVPITNGRGVMDSYDYWAVGINCCEAAANTFRCGEFNNPFARSGLRLLDDTNRSYFRLAVQQAEATYKIRANHPLFFTWLQDPIAEMNQRARKGYRFFMLCVAVYFGVHFFCVATAILFFSRLGRLTLEQSAIGKSFQVGPRTAGT